MTMLRKNYGEAGGDQKSLCISFSLLMLRDMTFMVYKYPAKDDDRWLFVPAINMVWEDCSAGQDLNFVGSISPMKMAQEGHIHR